MKVPHPVCEKCPFLDPADFETCTCIVIDRLLENPPSDMEELESILDFWGIPRECPRISILLDKLKKKKGERHMKVYYIAINAEEYEIRDHDLTTAIPTNAKKFNKFQLPGDIRELLELNDIFDQLPNDIYVEYIDSSSWIIYYVIP